MVEQSGVGVSHSACKHCICFWEYVHHILFYFPYPCNWQHITANIYKYEVFKFIFFQRGNLIVQALFFFWDKNFRKSWWCCTLTKPPWSLRFLIHMLCSHVCITPTYVLLLMLNTYNVVLPLALIIVVIELSNWLM